MYRSLKFKISITALLIISLIMVFSAFRDLKSTEQAILEGQKEKASLFKHGLVSNIIVGVALTTLCTKQMGLICIHGVPAFDRWTLVLVTHSIRLHTFLIVSSTSHWPLDSVTTCHKRVGRCCTAAYSNVKARNTHCFSIGYSVQRAE